MSQFDDEWDSGDLKNAPAEERLAGLVMLVDKPLESIKLIAEAIQTKSTSEYSETNMRNIQLGAESIIKLAKMLERYVLELKTPHAGE